MNYRCGNTNIWIKRDDTLDFAFGGNKVRIYEYLAGVILNSGSSKVVTYGSVFSNYLRVTAAVCANLNVSCDLIVLDEHDNVTEQKMGISKQKPRGGGNATLLNFYDANIIHCQLANAHNFIDEYQKKLKMQGINFLWIPGGGHLPEGSFGYVDAAFEIQKQLKNENIKIDAVFLPCGTGTTQAGLIYGFKNTDVKVIGVTVSRNIKRCKSEIDSMLETMKLIDHTENTDIHFNYDVIQGEDIRYGYVNEAISNTMYRIANIDGIFLDPIYNAKAFNGMEKYLESHNDFENVLYINTGGEPNLFMEERK